MGDWYEKGFAAGTQVATLNGQVASLSAAVKALQEALAAGEIPSGTKASITFD
jgi:outer membrane murein-binding lipoprotein Lpp